MAAPAFRAAGALTTATRSGSTLTVTPALPAGWQPGDLLVVAVAAWGMFSGINALPPSGWAALDIQRGAAYSTGRDVDGWWIVRQAQAGDVAPSVTANDPGGQASMQAVCFAYSGADGVDVFSDTTFDNVTGIYPPGVTPHNSGETLVGAGLWNTGSGGATIHAVLDTGWTQRYQSVAGTHGIVVWDGPNAMASTGTGVDLKDAGNNLVSAATVGFLLAVTAAVAPPMPVLTGPVNAATLDATQPIPFSFTFKSADGGYCQAWALRCKASGAGSYSYWNATTAAWQSTIVWNSGSFINYPSPDLSRTLTVPGGALANGSDYNWSFATQESLRGLQGPFANDITFTARAVPTVVVNAPPVGTMQPTVTWTTTPGSGATQTAYQVVVEDGAFGTTPGSGGNVYNTGAEGGDQSWTPPAPLPLVNGTTYRVFVQATETGGLTSSWAYATWTVALTPPTPPVLTAIPESDPATGAPRVALAVQGADGRYNLLDAANADAPSFEGSVGGWSGSQSTVARSSAYAADGSYSLSATATAAGQIYAVSPMVAVTPGQLAVCTATLAAAATPRSARVYCNFYDATSAYLTSTGIAASSGDSIVAGKQMATVTTIPAGAAYLRLVCNWSGVANGEVHYVDKAGVYLYDPTGQNLLDNGGFENGGVGGWLTAGAGTSVALSFDRCYTGVPFCAKTTWGTFAAGYQTVGAALAFCAQAGQQYTASAMVWVPAGNPGAFLDIYGTVSLVSNVGTGTSSTGSWAFITVTGTRTTSELCQVRMLNSAATTAGQTCYVGYLKVEVGGAATAFVPRKYSNLLWNPGFETGTLAGWAAVGASAPAATASATPARQGSWAARLAWTTGSTGGNAGFKASRLVIAGRPYTFAADVYVPSGSTGVQLAAYGAGNPTTVSATTAANDAWVRVSVTFTPTATAYMNLQVQPGAAAAAGSVCYVDDAQLEHGVAANPFVDGNAAGAAWASANSLLSAAAGSFEDGTTGGWTAGANWTVANSAARALSGTKSLKCTRSNGTAGNGWAAIGGIAVAPNTVYTASFWVYASAATAYQIQANNLGGALGVASFTPTANAWTPVSLTFVTGPTDTTITLYLDDNNNGAPTSGSTIYLDQAQVEKRAYSTDFGTNGNPASSSATAHIPWGARRQWGAQVDQATSATVEYSDDGGTTWQTVRGADAVDTSAPGETATVYDYEAPLGAQRRYRAQTIGTTGGNTLASAWSPVVAARVDGVTSWLADPTDPTTALRARIIAADSLSRDVDAAVHTPLPAPGEDVTYPIVVFGAARPATGGLTFRTSTKADREALIALLRSRRPLLLRQSPDLPGEAGDARYLAFSGISENRTVQPGQSPLRDIKATVTEVAAP